MIEFFMAMDPPTVTAQEHKVMFRDGKPIFYDPPELKAARVKLMGYLARYKPRDPFTGGVELLVTWCFKPKSGTRPGTYRITKPDTDNLQKLLKDCMTRTKFWKDDALVCREIVEKYWSDVPGIFIRITPIKERKTHG